MSDAPRPLVKFMPESRSGLITVHDYWCADFEGHTRTFDTQADAVAFCVRRWKRKPRIIGAGQDERKIPGNCPTCGRPFDGADS